MRYKNVLLIIGVFCLLLGFVFYKVVVGQASEYEPTQNEMVRSAPEVNVSSVITQKPTVVYLDPPEKIYVTPVDYSSLTRSKIISHIETLQELIDVTSKWESMSEINRQAIRELNRANTHLENGEYMHPYTEEDFLLLSYMIQIEAGASITTEEEQCLVGCVIINRRNQGGINKNKESMTIKDVINEAGQYAICKYSHSLGKNTFYVDVDTVDMSKVNDRCKESARKVLEGEYTCPENVVFQALFKQGEVYKEFYHAPPFDNTTYFCYGG